MLDDRFVPKAEAAANDDGDDNSNVMVVSGSQMIPETTCVDRTDEEAGSSTNTNSAEHSMIDPHHETVARNWKGTTTSRKSKIVTTTPRQVQVVVSETLAMTWRVGLVSGHTMTACSKGSRSL